MTPAEHIDTALELMGQAADYYVADMPQGSFAPSLAALNHILIAIAIEVGVPHGPAVSGGGPGAPAA